MTVKIWIVDFYNTTDGRSIERTERFDTEVLARQAAEGWNYMGGQPATRIYPVHVNSVRDRIGYGGVI